MAQMIPEGVPSGRPRSERRIFDILQNLPDDYLVYYEPVIADRYPDFVIIAPDLGLMIIEVKGWTLNSIEKADDNQVIVSFNGKSQACVHPIHQARNYMFKLMGEFAGDPSFDLIRHATGKYKGGFIFPFGHSVFLAGITAQQLKESGLSNVFPSSRVVTKDLIDNWENYKPSELKLAIKEFFDPFWHFEPLTERQVDLLRAVIHPEIVVKRQTENVNNTPAIYVLDQKQEVLARKIGDGHRVINGVAGSGKTILLIHRARWLSNEDPNRRILVLCYNRCLSSYLASSLCDCNNVDVKSFHQWGVSIGAKFTFKSDLFGERVLSKVMSLSEMNKYDAVFVDEAQDFAPNWLKCAVQSLKCPEDGDLVIVADGNQGLYRPGDFKWIDVGIKARGRVIPLYRNYRNTQQILQVAKAFASGDQEDKGLEITPLIPKTSIRNGSTPIVFRGAGLEEEINKVVQIVSDLLNGKWNGHQVNESLQPEDIAILYSHLSTRRRVLHTLQQIISNLEKQSIPVIWLQDRDDESAWKRLNEPAVKIQTIHSSKGLQYKAVIVVRAEILPIRTKPLDEVRDARVMYVALTRAENYLAVTFSGESAFTKKIQSACEQASTSFSFFCDHCGYCGIHSRSVLTPGKSKWNIRCPKCKETTLFVFPESNDN